MASAKPVADCFSVDIFMPISACSTADGVFTYKDILCRTVDKQWMINLVVIEELKNLIQLLFW